MLIKVRLQPDVSWLWSDAREADGWPIMRDSSGRSTLTLTGA